jgi:hypothetical protein
MTGEDVDADLEPRITYSREAVGRLVSRAARRTDRAPRDAKARPGARRTRRRR